MELSSPKLKKLLFLGEPLRVFHHCFFRGFHFSPLIFTTVFRVFSLLIAFFHVTNFVAFLSGTSFLCCTVSATDLRELFLLSGVFTLHTFPTFGTICFYHGFPWSWQFFLEGCRASHWGSKLRTSLSVCLNHTVFTKRY